MPLARLRGYSCLYLVSSMEF